MIQLVKDAYKGESVPNPTPSAKELLAMTPDEVVAWKRATLYGPESAGKIAEKLKAEDIPKLEEQRDLLREKADLELSQVEGPEDVAQLNKANITSLKAQTLNEIVDAAKARFSPAVSTKQSRTEPTTQAQSLEKAPEVGGGIQKYKIGTSPQTYSLQERLAQSADEKANGEQPVRVRNDRTGEEQIVLESDLKPVQTVPASAKEPKRDLDAELRAAKLDPSVFPTKASKEAALKRAKALAKPEPAMSLGPGAAAKGEPGTYFGLQQLVDQLKAITPEKRGIGQRAAKFIVQQKQALADRWAEGKSTTAKSIGRLISIGQSIKDIARGVRTPTDMDRKVGELDYALQKSAAQSKQAGRVLKKQIPNKANRDALAIWVDAGGREDMIRNALSKLPDKTKPAIRRAVEIASNLPDDLKQHAELVRQYFGMRENDAIANEIFEKGLQDYFTHIWKREENMPASVKEFINGGRVNTYFRFSRKRTISTLLEGILQGKEPVLDSAEVIPFYNYLLDRAIASRQFIKQASDLTAEDGRPALAPTGIASKVEKGTTDEAMIIKPRAKAEETADYRQVDHPALRKWKWAGTDEQGRPTFYQSDLLVHPDFYERIARFMDRGRLTPTKTGKALLRAGSEVKGMKLGLLSLFHQVHVGSHALWHWTNPFRTRFIDWEAPETRFAIEQGHLKLAPDPSEIVHFSEGIVSRGLVQKIPIIGPWSRAYSEWFFGDYIPRLKLATFENALDRNRRAYVGKLTDEEIAARVGDAVNNAYGELNQLFLGRAGRDPRFQRLLRGLFLAPDFGEARLRFVEKAFTRYGHEERLALATMLLTMYTAARIGNWSSHGDPEWELKRAFMVKSGQHWWTMRSVLGDLVHAVSDFGNFMRVRLSPLYGRTALELLSGRDQSGLKRGYGEQAIDVAKQFVPIQLGSMTRDDQKFWESFISSLGVSAIRDTPEQDMHKLVADWKAKSNNPKLQAEIERAQKETLAPSDYRNLRLYLQWDDEVKARQELERLRQTKSESTIVQALRPNKPFTGSWKYESGFVKSLTPPQRETLEQAKTVRKQIFERYLKIRTPQKQP